MSKSASLPRIRSKARPADQRPRLVERELERAQLRIRTVDSLYSVCLLVGGVLAYLLLVIGLDYWLRLSDGARQALWAIAGIGAAVFIGLRIIYPMVRHINPYYTARMIEKATPGSKNGIINWLDLREQQVNPIIRDALSRRAVHELDSANMEEAIPTRNPIRTGITVGVVLLGLIATAWMLPDQIGSLFQRALFPFKATIIPTHTRLEVLSPVNEPVPEVDVNTLEVKEIPVERGQPVEFRVITHGTIPNEVVMESQAAGDKQPVVKPLRQDKKGDPTQPWRVALSSSDIPVDGFLFWFRANDGITRKFRLIVTSKIPPSVSDLEVRMTYPAYTKRRETVQGLGPIKAIEGTQVDIQVTADRAASSGELEVLKEELDTEGKPIEERLLSLKLVRPEGAAEDNKLVLAEPLKLTSKFISKEDKAQKFFYKLVLVSPENLTGTSPKYPLDVISDLAPRVLITRVKDKEVKNNNEEFEVEANAIVPVAGNAHDDIAMGQVNFKLKTSDGRDLFFTGTPPAEKKLQKANGFTPPPVNFLLTLDLNKLTLDDNPATAKPIHLKPGTIIEVVVEGVDTAEPKAHFGTSQMVKLRVKGEASDKQRQEQEKQAKDQQQKHDQQKKERQQQEPQEEESNKKEKNEGNEENQSGDKNQTGEKDKQSGDKNQTGEKDKQSGDKNQTGEKDKQSGDKNQTGEKDKQSGDKNQAGEKDKQSGDKNQTGEKDKQADDKNQTGEKDKQADDKNQTGEKDKQSGDKNQTGEKDKQSGDKNQTGEKDKQSGDKNQTGEKDKQSGDKNQTGEKDKQSGDKNKNQTGEKDKQGGDTNGEKSKENGVEATETKIEVISPTLEPSPTVDPETLPVLNVLVEQGKPVEFRVLTTGKIPERVTFEYQIPGDKELRVKPMNPSRKGNAARPWRITMAPEELLPEGFLFWFRAGDTVTRKFKLVLTAQQAPKISLENRLTFPAYTNKAPQTTAGGALKGIEGTQVKMNVIGDRAITTGYLEVFQELSEAEGSFVAVHQQLIKLVRPKDEQADAKLMLTKPLVLTSSFIPQNDKQKFYAQLSVVSADNQMGKSPRYPIQVTPDKVPTVVIQKVMGKELAPGQVDLDVQANAIVPVQGIAQDDIAIKDITLHIRDSKDGEALYLIGDHHILKNMQRAIGNEPPPAPFTFVIDLSKLTNDPDKANPRGLIFEVGTILEVYVEAKDGAEPKPHTGRSQVIKLHLKGKATGLERDEQADRSAKIKDQDKQDQDKNKQNEQKEIDKNEEEKQKNQSNQDKQQPGEASGEKDKQSGDKNQTGEKDKQSGDKNQTGEKDKQSGDKNQTGEKDKQSGDKNQTGEKDKQSGDKNQTGEKDKQSGDKNQTGEKDKQSGDKNQTGEKDKQSGDKNQTGEKDKQAGDKNQTGEKDKQAGDKNQTGEKDKQAGDKNQTGEKDKQAGDKNQTGEKDKQAGDKNQTGEKDKQAEDKNQTGEKDKQAGDKNQTGEKDKQAGDKNQTGEKDKQSGDKNQTGEKDKQSGDKNQTGEKDKQSGEKESPDKKEKETKPSDEGAAGGGAGTNPNDKGNLEDILDKVAKEGKSPTKGAPQKEGKPQEISDDAKNRDLALDTLADKLRKNEIDRKLADKLKELGLTKEQALKLIGDKKQERIKSTGKQADQGPSGTLTTKKQRTEQIVDPASDVPDELSSSYRTFTEKRNQQPKK